MRQQAEQQGEASLGADLLGMIGAIAGSIIAYLITSHLSGLESVVACVVIISFSVFASTQRSQPMLWWFNLGAIAGGIGGTGSVLGNFIPQIDLPDKETIRYLDHWLLKHYRVCLRHCPRPKPTQGERAASQGLP